MSNSLLFTSQLKCFRDLSIKTKIYFPVSLSVQTDEFNSASKKLQGLKYLTPSSYGHQVVITLRDWQKRWQDLQNQLAVSASDWQENKLYKYIEVYSAALYKSPSSLPEILKSRSPSSCTELYLILQFSLKSPFSNSGSRSRMAVSAYMSTILWPALIAVSRTYSHSSAKACGGEIDYLIRRWLCSTVFASISFQAKWKILN